MSRIGLRPWDKTRPRGKPSGPSRKPFGSAPRVGERRPRPLADRLASAGRSSPRRPWGRPRSRGAVNRSFLPSRAWVQKSWNEILPLLPKVALPKPGWRVWVMVGLIGAAGGGLFAVRDRIAMLPHHPRLAVRSLEVNGLQRIGQEEFFRLAGVSSGDPWLLVDAEEVRRRLLMHPWIDEVKLERPWLGQVQFVVQECVPVALLEWGGTIHGVARDMRILPAIPEETRLPRIRGVGHRTRPGLHFESFERAFRYVGAIHDEGELEGLDVVVTLDPTGHDTITVQEKELDVILEEPVAPEDAVRNLAAFLETLETPGTSRGSLHVFSKTTAVWKVAKA